MNFKRNFDKEGVITIKNQIAKSQISKFETFFCDYRNSFFKNHNDKRLWIDISQNSTSHPIADLIREIYFSLNLEDISSNLLGQKVTCDVALLNEVGTPVHNSNGSGGGWHRDHYSQGIKIIIYINEANKENGCLQVVKGTHKLYSLIYQFLISLLSSIINLKPIFLVGRSPSYRSKDINRIINIFFKNSIKSLEGSSGDIIFFNTKCLHRGKPPEFSDLPMALTFYCETAHKKNITLKKRRSKNLLLNI